MLRRLRSINLAVNSFNFVYLNKKLNISCKCLLESIISKSSTEVFYIINMFLETQFSRSFKKVKYIKTTKILYYYTTPIETNKLLGYVTTYKIYVCISNPKISPQLNYKVSLSKRTPQPRTKHLTQVRL